MPIPRRSAIVLSAAVLTMSMAGPAVAGTGGQTVHAASSPTCRVTHVLPADLLMTCTGVPASEEWRVGADCYDPTTSGYIFKYGGIVTGNGTSGITGCYPDKNAQFYEVS